MKEDIKDLSDTIKPKSIQMNADDLITGPKVIKITNVKRAASKQQPVQIFYIGDEGKPYLPCLTMRRAIMNIWGTDGHQWVGRYLKLFRDADAIFQGEKVGGIRVSHLSHIDRDVTLTLTMSKGNRKPVTFRKLPPYPDTDFQTNAPKWIAAIKSGKLDIETLLSKAECLTDEQILQLEKEIENND